MSEHHAPDPGRVYNCIVGGDDNREADRVAAAWVNAAAPDFTAMLRANRAFHRRAVRFMAEQGVTQFLDLGAGFPISPTTYEIASSIDPDAVVVYTDIDPEVGVRLGALPGTHGSTAFVVDDVTRPGSVLDNPAVRSLVDFGRPVGVLLVALLHFVTEEQDPMRLVGELRSALPEGSFLVISHAACDVPWDARNSESVLKDALADLTRRTREQVTDFFGDFELIDPGVVTVAEWRPDEALDPAAPPLGIHCGVARKTRPSSRTAMSPAEHAGEPARTRLDRGQATIGVPATTRAGGRQ
ncbi:SAM-dependent methyltransferase [Nonomuraea basaltis]|uniref:SAM-dependent methyltransferase n=1 Tax=Nonomuraea basaltis TaxID=2495887 RepID=UPI00110C53A4|nr:SAM-dependent methyltransferase [Nonomuraea basaltis]TMR90117.1 SAM-dependent methyltransferase [Nonomuraea basaltis]